MAKLPPEVLEAQARLLELSDHDLAVALRYSLKMYERVGVDPSEWVTNFAREMPAHFARFGSFKGKQRQKAVEVVAKAISLLAKYDVPADEWPW